MSKGLPHGGVLVQAHVRNAEDYDSPEGEVFNAGWEDQGFLVHVTHTIGSGFLSAAWQSDYGRDFERPRNNSQTVRFCHPFETSHRFTASYRIPGVAGFREIALTGFLGGYEQRTDQDRFPTATTGRSIERADVSANDFHVKGSAERLVGPARLNFGVDVNGRYGLEALDIIQEFDVTGADYQGYHQRVRRRCAPCRRGRLRAGGIGARALDARLRRASCRPCDHGEHGGVLWRSLYVERCRIGRGRDRRSVTATQGHGKISQEFGIPCCRTDISGGPPVAASSRETRTSSRRPVCNSIWPLGTRWPGRSSPCCSIIRINDLVERYQTQPDFFFFRNRGRAGLRGLEVESRSELALGFSLELAAQIARGRALDDDAYLDDISPVTFSMVGRKDFGHRWSAQARAAWSAEDIGRGPVRSWPRVPPSWISALDGESCPSWNCVSWSAIFWTMRITRALMHAGCMPPAVPQR